MQHHKCILIRSISKCCLELRLFYAKIVVHPSQPIPKRTWSELMDGNDFYFFFFKNIIINDSYASSKVALLIPLN